MKTTLILLFAITAAACSAPVASLTGTLKKTDSTHEAQASDENKPAPVATTAAITAQPDAAAPAAALDPFAGAAAFAGAAPDDESSSHHLGSSNAGKDCFACHGKDLGAPQFILAGTIQAATSGVEIRVVDATGTELAATTTDSDGNFWVKGDTAFPTGAHVGIRDASSEHKMSGAVSVGACNQGGCHSHDRPIVLTN
jgi:hypothetical protein